MSLHFRRIVSIILNEYVANQLKKKPADVSIKEFTDFLKSLKTHVVE